MMGRLQSRKAIVTGAGQQDGDVVGNGRAIAMLFAQEGAEVLAVDRDLARAEDTVRLIRQEGGRAFAAQADIARPDDVDRLVLEASDRWGGLDTLINNVGVGSPDDGPAHQASNDAFDHVMGVNLRGTWLMIKAALPVLRAGGGGAIVNISSTASRRGAQLVAYEASKAAVDRLTVHVALGNARHGIRCNAVLPGMVHTPMARHALSRKDGVPADEAIERYGVHVPLKGGMGSGWDTAHAALFLASDEARFITGVLLPVDGGMTAGVA